MPFAADLRVAARSAGIAAVTPVMLGCLELGRARARSDGSRAIVERWKCRYGRMMTQLYGLEILARGPHVEKGQAYPGRDALGRGRIFVMNHRSMLDIFICLALIEADLVSRADVARWPVIGLAARRVGTLFVERKSPTSGATVVHSMCAAVAAGRGVLVYAEGTTFAGDDVRPFRSGAFRVARETGAEIVPLGIAYEGDGVAFGDESFFSHYRRVAGRPRTPVALVVGGPVPGEACDLGTARERSRAQVQALVLQARALLSKV